MQFIFENWSQLNLIDRAWFLGGAWLLMLFIGMVGFKTFRRCRGDRRSPAKDS